MKKTSLLALVLIGTLTLSGCFGGDEETPADGGTETKAGTYKTPEYQLNYPDSWEVFEKRDFTSDIPPNTQVVFRSKKKNEVFIANVSVIKNFLPEGMSKSDYAKKVLESHQQVLQNFKKLEETETDDGVIVYFEGKRAAGEPMLKFVQKIVVKEKSSFLATASYITNEDEQIAKEAQEIVRSLKTL